MHPIAALALASVLLSVNPAQAAKDTQASPSPPLPQRDLTVELRQIEEGRDEAGHYRVGGEAPAAWEPQMVQVRNGERAVLRMEDAVPMQWTASVTAPAGASVQALGQTGLPAQASGPAGGAANGAQVRQALVWFDAGQSLAVRPRWPGGNRPAELEIEVQRSAPAPRAGAPLPQQTRNTVSTTLTLKLAEWVTIAATGKTPKSGAGAGSGSYSSESATQSRRLLQVRVMAP